MIDDKGANDPGIGKKRFNKTDIDWHEEPAKTLRSARSDKYRDDIEVDDGAEDQEAEKQKFVPFLKSFWALHLCAAIGLIILANLSLWQFSRLDDKIALIERAGVRANEPAVAAPGPAMWEDLTSDIIDYMPVKVTGQFILGELFYFDTLTKPKGRLGGQGYFLYAPFIAEDGWTVLVNRGFIPLDRKDFSTRLGSAPPRGEITITGLARKAEVASMFSADDNPKTHEWFVREPKNMADALGLLPERTAPYTIDLQEILNIAGDLPQAGETRMTFSNNHLQYAFTWAALALALIGVYLAFLIKAWLERDKPNPQTEDEADDDDDEVENERYRMLSKAARKDRNNQR
ncbi:SURF1 family protein [Pseudovibrio sp. Tun.PSC04-5.I4]|uniref:SURF1 family protein n=1 Tax=Pseudovibrio sp. Tun.PSC04-5.I4 TaxID=1798213 RepID=UPI000888C028|nr:SURF1 family protein [Pseudovibrio sp. Tun.PSC04-5.I4]SDQ79929.1 surfeit locus 1 family protein [Pseudovibrio sp. Tun.PSC04-5.I4]